MCAENKHIERELLMVQRNSKISGPEDYELYDLRDKRLV